METLKKINQINSDYNQQPVFYCKNCLSLKIRNIKSINNSEYCDDCGSTNIDNCNIKDWEIKYKQKYGHSFLENY